MEPFEIDAEERFLKDQSARGTFDRALSRACNARESRGRVVSSLATTFRENSPRLLGAGMRVRARIIGHISRQRARTWHVKSQAGLRRERFSPACIITRNVYHYPNARKSITSDDTGARRIFNESPRAALPREIAPPDWTFSNRDREIEPARQLDAPGAWIASDSQDFPSRGGEETRRQCRAGVVPRPSFGSCAFTIAAVTR